MVWHKRYAGPVGRICSRLAASHSFIKGFNLHAFPAGAYFCMCASSRALLHVGSLSLWDRQPSNASPFPSGPCVPPGTPYQNTLGAVPQGPLTLKLRLDTNDAKHHRPYSAADTLSRCLRCIICGVTANRQQKATTEKHVRPCQTKVMNLKTFPTAVP